MLGRRTGGWLRMEGALQTIQCQLMSKLSAGRCQPIMNVSCFRFPSLALVQTFPEPLHIPLDSAQLLRGHTTDLHPSGAYFPYEGETLKLRDKFAHEQLLRDL